MQAQLFDCVCHDIFAEGEFLGISRDQLLKRSLSILLHTVTQECIPVGCAPSAAVAVSGGGGMYARGDVCLEEDVCLGGVHPPDLEVDTHLLWTE